MSNSKIYVISDTHFGHNKIIEYEPSRRWMAGFEFSTIEEHDRFLVEQWNSTVRDQDTVWHLGDVYFGPKDSERMQGVLASLKGYKRLVLGNHDAGRVEFLQSFFDKIYGVAEYGRCILSHIPVHPCQLEKRYKKNIHGHMHSKVVIRQGTPVPDDRYVCVSVENTGFKPILLERLVQ